MSDAPRRDKVERLTHDLLDTIVAHPEFATLQIREIISAVASLLVTLIVHVAGKYVSEDQKPAFRAFMANEISQMAVAIEMGLYERDEATTPVVH